MSEPFNFFTGKSQGSVQGQPGTSHVERNYEFVLNGKFLFVQNKSVYEPRVKNPTGEIHEDWGLIRYDRAEKNYVFRQFHIEGFVNQYRLDQLAENRQTICFVTKNIENIAPGWRARETYQILGPDEFIEAFELAPPDKEFEVYVENRFRRVHSE